MKFRVRHTTEYHYQQPVSHCYNLGYVLPRNTHNQTVVKSEVKLTPTQSYTETHTDYFGNRVFHFNIPDRHSHLDITAISLLEVNDPQPLDMKNTISCSESRTQLYALKSEEALRSREFVLDSPMIRNDSMLAEFAKPFFGDDRPLLQATLDLTQYIFKEFTYDSGFSTIATPLHEVIKHKRGVCQDFAQLAIGCLRSLGFPARYVSGYLETLPPPGQKKLVGADASHAWFSVYVPGMGWFDFDPTNNKMAGVQHITTAWGRDYSDVPPIKGVIFGGGKSPRLNVAVDVERMVEKRK